MYIVDENSSKLLYRSINVSGAKIHGTDLSKFTDKNGHKT